jgi:hypothetical protein
VGIMSDIRIDLTITDKMLSRWFKMLKPSEPLSEKKKQREIKEKQEKLYYSEVQGRFDTLINEVFSMKNNFRNKEKEMMEVIKKIEEEVNILRIKREKEEEND